MRKSPLCFTERFLLCHSAQYEALHRKQTSDRTSEKRNLRNGWEDLEKFGYQYQGDAARLDLIEKVVNIGTICMKELKSVIRRVEKKVRSFALLTPQREALESPGCYSERGEACATVTPRCKNRSSRSHAERSTTAIWGHWLTSYLALCRMVTTMSQGTISWNVERLSTWFVHMIL